jgi:hypothetical protein
MQKFRVLLGLIVLVALAQLIFFSRYAVDDAYISFRYARNLAHGLGLVFNPGEHVEGFTNFSFTVLIAPAFWLGVDPLVWARGISTIALVLIFILTWRLAGLYVRDPLHRLLPLALLALSPALYYWSMAGLETVVFACAFLWALYLELAGNRSFVYPAAHLFLILTRPEGFLASAILWAHRFWQQRRIEWRLVLPYVAGALAYVGLKAAYYGSLVPNTFLAKVTGSHLSHQTLAFLVDQPLAMVGLAGFVAAWRPALLLPGVLLVTFLVVPEVLGGDGMPYYRFYVHLLPLIALGATLAVLRFSSRAGRAIAWSLVGVALAWSLIGYPFHVMPAVLYTNRIVEVGRLAGEWVKSNTGASDWIAVNTAGALPFHAERPCIDMLGLCDSTIARSDPKGFVPNVAIGPGHAKGDGEYVLRRRPALIVFGNSAGSRAPLYVSDQQMAASADFHELYAFRGAILEQPEWTGRFYELDKSRASFPIDRFGESLKPGLYMGRFEGLGLDMSIDYSRSPALGLAHTYPTTFAFYVRANHPLARLASREAILPPPPIPEEFFNPEQLLYAGAFHASHGRYQDAERLFRRALETSDDFYTHFLLGRVYLEEGRRDLAKQEMIETLRRKPGMPEALEMLRSLE